MNSKTTLRIAVPVFFALVAVAPAQAVDAGAAQDLFKKEKCAKCHSVDKTKSGPSLKSIAEKYKGKAGAEDAIIKAMTTSPKVKLSDGSEEEHKALKTKDGGEQKNLAQWILSQ